MHILPTSEVEPVPKRDVMVWIAKAWSARNRLRTMWKSYLPATLKINFFRAVVESLNNLDYHKAIKGQVIRWNILQNASCHTEQILTATPHWKRSVWKCSKVNRYHQRTKNKICWSLLAEQSWTSGWYSSLDSKIWSYSSWSTI